MLIPVVYFISSVIGAVDVSGLMLRHETDWTTDGWSNCVWYSSW